jgi:RNA polymerase sigma-70 factor (ECF subfamily)
MRVEEQEHVRAAVGRLPELYRQVVTMRFFAEFSILEIAAATGRPEGTVKAQLHRGLERLRWILGEEPR